MALEGIMQQQEPHLWCRFLYSIRFIEYVLKMAGIFLVQSVGISKYSDVLRLIWSGWWLVLDIESCIYIFLEKGVEAIVATIYSTNYKMLTGAFTHSLIRLSSLVFEMPSHLFLLILANGSFFKQFFTILEPVDLQLGRPDLTRIQYYSISCLIFTAWTVWF